MFQGNNALFDNKTQIKSQEDVGECVLKFKYLSAKKAIAVSQRGQCGMGVGVDAGGVYRFKTATTDFTAYQY